MSALESLSPEAIAIAAFVFFAVLAFFRGIVRQLVGMICVAAGCIGGYWLFRNAGGFLAGAVGELNATWRFGICAIAGFAVYGILRVIANIFLGFGLEDLLGRPFGQKRGKGIIGAILSVIPTAFVVLVVAACFKLAGGFTDLERIDTIILDNPGTNERKAAPLTKLAEQIRESIIGRVLEKGDPTSVDEVHGVTSLLLLSKDDTAWRDVVNNPLLEKILSQPEVAALLADQEVNRALERGQHATLLNDSRLWDVASNPDIRLALGELDLPQLVTNALYKKKEQGNDTLVRRAPEAEKPSWQID